jgi:hypothetical protein
MKNVNIIMFKVFSDKTIDLPDTVSGAATV